MGQSVVHLAACAVVLWPCTAHGPPLAAHSGPDTLDHHHTISHRKERALSHTISIFPEFWNILKIFVRIKKKMEKVCSVGRGRLQPVTITAEPCRYSCRILYSRDESFRVPSSPATTAAARLGRSPITYDMPLLRVRRRDAPPPAPLLPWTLAPTPRTDPPSLAGARHRRRRRWRHAALAE